jgi:hypothetical protein
MNAIQTIKEIHSILMSFDDFESLHSYVMNPYVQITYAAAFGKMLHENDLTPPENTKIKEILSAFLIVKFPAQTFPMQTELSDAAADAALLFVSFDEVNAESINAFVDYLVKFRAWTEDNNNRRERDCMRLERSIRDMLDTVKRLRGFTVDQMQRFDGLMNLLRVEAKKRMTPERFARIEAEINSAGLFFSRTTEMME